MLMMEPPPAFGHLGRHGLDGKKLMTQIYRHAVVPILGRDFGEFVPVVVGGIVHQHANGAVTLLRFPR